MSINIKDNTKEVLSALEKAKNKGLKAVGLTAEKYAKKNTPVDTGRLRNSISHAVEGDSAYIGSNVEYAPPVELGGRNNRAHHMLQRAVAEHKDEYRKILEDSMKKA